MASNRTTQADMLRKVYLDRMEMSFNLDSIISQDYWRSVFTSAHERVRGYYTQVALEHHYNEVWLA